MNEEKKKTEELQEYEVSIAVTGRYRITVKASSPEEAKKLGEASTCDADFGELEDIDWSTDHVEDASGNYHYV